MLAMNEQYQYNNFMSDSTGEIPQLIPQLETRIGKYDSALEKVTSLHDKTLGTPDGPPQYDLSLIEPDKHPEFYK